MAKGSATSTKPNTAILVTGASSGIGRKITERLAAEGCFVYAGARKAEDLAALCEIRNVQAVRLDVTMAQDIAAVAVTVEKGQYELYGLVNNAGVATVGPIVNGNDAEFDLVMAVNAAGAYRITSAFAPMISKTRGRIVMIGSISGILAGCNMSVYSMSKHAIEALTDSLAQEMLPAGVHVCVVEPGGVNTNLVRSAIARGVRSPSPDLSKFDDPEEVAAVVMQALFEAEPRRRYLVVANADEARRTICKQIEQLVQLNEGHSYSYDRDALVKMLDEEIERSCMALSSQGEVRSCRT